MNTHPDDIPLMVMTNDPTESKLETLQIIYESIAFGQLAYLDGKDPDTGEIVPLLVGLEPTEDGKFRIYPIAKLFTKDDPQINYMVPSGTGTYHSLTVGDAIDVHVECTEEEGPSQGLDKGKLN